MSLGACTLSVVCFCFLAIVAFSLSFYLPSPFPSPHHHHHFKRLSVCLFVNPEHDSDFFLFSLELMSFGAVGPLQNSRIALASSSQLSPLFLFYYLFFNFLQLLELMFLMTLVYCGPLRETAERASFCVRRLRETLLSLAIRQTRCCTREHLNLSLWSIAANVFICCCCCRHFCFC